MIQITNWSRTIGIGSGIGSDGDEFEEISVRHGVTGRFKTSHWEALQNQPLVFLSL